MATNIEVFGLEETKIALNSIQDIIDRELPTIIRSTAESTVGVAKNACPRDTGALQDSIRAEVISKNQADVIAGSDTEVRGYSPYEYSAKGDLVWFTQASSEYADIVDKEGSPKKRGQGYMSEFGFRWAELLVMRKLQSMVAKIVSMVG